VKRTTEVIKLDGHTYRVCNKKIEKAVEECVTAMSELTIEESKAARVCLDHALESMYKRSPDTILGTIQPPS
jgi:hypothetical protein